MRFGRQPTEDIWVRFEAEAMPHHADLFRHAMWPTRDPVEAEDLVQETFAQALQSFHRFAAGTNCRAWLISIMRHHQSKKWRAGARFRLVSDNEDSLAETVAFEPHTPEGITEEEVLRALRSLPEQFQEVVALADIEEMSYKEIASTLQIPIGTVMSRLARARKLLRSLLAGYANEHGIGRNTVDRVDRRKSMS